MAKTVCKILGVVFLLVGIAGFAAPHLLGAHLTPAHNLVHLASGAIALYLGFAGSMSAARTLALENATNFWINAGESGGIRPSSDSAC